MRHWVIGVVAAGSLGHVAAAQEYVGVSAAVFGEVLVAPFDASPQRVAASGEDMFIGDLIESRLSSGMQILLRDETVFTIGPECQLTIDEFVYDPDTGAGQIAASITQGFFRFVTGLISANNPDAMSVTTPSTDITVRGTIAEGVVGDDSCDIARAAEIIEPTARCDPDDATLAILRGPGYANNTSERTGSITVESGGQTVTIARANWGTFVPAEGLPPSAPFRVSPLLNQIMASNIAPAAGPGSGVGLPGSATDLSNQNLALSLADATLLGGLQTLSRDLDDLASGTVEVANGLDGPSSGGPTTFAEIRAITSGTASFSSAGTPLSDGGFYNTAFQILFAERAITAQVDLFDTLRVPGGGSLPLACVQNCNLDTATGAAVLAGEARVNGNGPDELDFGRLDFGVFNAGGSIDRIEHMLELRNEVARVTGSGTAR